jgi:hypothetical protein
MIMVVIVMMMGIIIMANVASPTRPRAFSALATSSFQGEEENLGN